MESWSDRAIKNAYGKTLTHHHKHLKNEKGKLPAQLIQNCMLIISNKNKFVKPPLFEGKKR